MAFGLVGRSDQHRSPDRRHLAHPPVSGRCDAVQLTRDPDGLARALARLDTSDQAIAGARWSSRPFVVYRKGGRTAPAFEK